MDFRRSAGWWRGVTASPIPSKPDNGWKPLVSLKTEPRVLALSAYAYRRSVSLLLAKLRVERLPVGADAGIADEPFFGMSFGHILCKL